MRNFKLLALFSLCLLCSSVVLAQTKQKPPVIRCGTMESLEAYFQANPGAKIQAQQNASQSGGSLRTADDSYRLNAIVTIPVVTHVVLGNPAIVTDADVDYFINRLNIDYAGLNPDSANAGAFLPLRGHSQIRFCRAKRTPGGLISTGIERRASATQANSNVAVDPIKRTAQGGLDAWDNTSYLNVWVGIGNAGLLGYATFPGTAGAADDGVFVAFDTYSNNSCYTDPVFNLGRTGSHEVGHYLGLYHNWGDDAACTGDDFRQLPGSCVLPAGLFNPAGQGNTATDIGDTPNQAGNTPFNCPTGVVTDACATTAPGKMYQNYMDYTADACYSMFTNKQVARMEWVVDNCRAGLKTSQGCSPPAGFPTIDAGIRNIISPGGGDFNPATCATTNYPVPSCPGTFIPRLSITNFGTTTITSISVTIVVGPNSVTVPFTINLISGASTTLVFPAQSLVVGANAISFTITTINGSPDTYTANNTVTTTATIVSPVVLALPFTQDFSGATFPPANMTLVNPNGNFTWVRSPTGNLTPGSASIDNYNNDGTGQTDDISTVSLTPPANPLPTDSVTISFDVAYKYFPNPVNYDALSVLVSTDCGATFTSVYSKSGPALATAGQSDQDYTTPATADWRRERIKIGGAFLTSGPLIVIFRNLNNYGNRLFLDNINISKPVDRDLGISAIINPVANICNSTFVPQVTVTNSGLQAVSSFRVGYQINNGTVVNQTFTQALASNASVTVTLAAATGIVPGSSNNIKVFTADPVAVSGTGDQQVGNDTLTKAFTYILLPLPFTQDFVTTTFPPPNMTLFNPTGTNTWVRNAAGNGTPGSAFINNFNFGASEIDDIRTQPLTPPLNPSVRDSVIISFDLAHRPYSVTNATFFDTLKVMISTDCGATFTPVYSRWATSTPSLATGAVSTGSYLVPAVADWRRERISIGGSLITGSSVIVAFRNVARLGNNIFLDNINIERTISRDIQLVSINQPGSIACTAITPSVTVKNTGVDTITGFKVGFVVDNGTPAVTTITGIILPRDATRTFNLTAATLPTGTHNIRVYTFEPITALGTGDQRPSNDTLTKVVQVVPIVAAPLAEGFELPTFPPAGWAINNPGGITWLRTTAAARSGSASVYIKNFKDSVYGNIDDLYSPQVSYNGVDSISLAFDVAALTFSYPGSTAIPLDTLEVFATNDCGTTLTSIYKKWGNELQTVNDPNYPQTTEFIPNTRNQWRRERIDLSAYANRSPIQLIFRNTTNNQNNIFLDNIDLTTKTLPAKLKAQGYLIYPSPFASMFAIQHYLSPTDLRGVAVYNSVGQRVYAQTYGAGGASAFIQVDMSHLANGLYTVVLKYTNRTISQKVIKNP